MFSPLSVPSLDCMNVKTRRRETLGKARFKETRVILTTQLNPWYVCLNIPRVKFFAKFESSLKMKRIAGEFSKTMNVCK